MSMTETSAIAPATSRPEPRPLRRILCPIDFSEASVAAVDEAVALARAGGGEITVLFVLPYAAPSRADRPLVPAGVSEAVTEDVEALLGPARAAGIPVRVCLKTGWPAREILEVVRRTAPDVVVMATHGRGGFKRRVLGSVTAEVLRNAICPVLTIGHRPPDPTLPTPARRDVVLCALGLSASSPRTLAHALDLARSTGARLILLHAFGDDAPDIRDARRRLRALVAAHERPGDRIEMVVVAGDPARQIQHMAAARRAALVVVGAKGLSDRLTGSTADRVIRNAPCAVFTVPSAPEAT
jgi:nucleotide-binding universal stress UspA family protein